MKTPMQELLQDIKAGGNAIYMIEQFYIKKEEQQIKNAWIHGAVRSPLKLKHINNPQGYFDSTFGEVAEPEAK